jgi:hypothetical protein
MTTDVAERSDVKTDTEALQDADTEGRGDASSTDERSTGAQTDTDADRDTTDKSSAPDGRAARLSALADAEREEARQSGREEALQEIQKGTSQTQREQNRQRLKQSFPTAQAAIDRVFAGAKDDYGAPRALTEAEQTAVKNALAGHNLVAWESASAEVSDIVRDAVYAKIHKDDHEAFGKLTAGDTELPAYLDAYAEVAALRTKAVKALDLESAIKASPSIKKAIAARDVEQYDEGFAAGLVAPAGTSPDGGRATGRTAPGMKSFAELEKGYGDGTNTKEQDAEYVRQRDARAKSR